MHISIVGEHNVCSICPRCIVGIDEVSTPTGSLHIELMLTRGLSLVMLAVFASMVIFSQQCVVLWRGRVLWSVARASI